MVLFFLHNTALATESSNEEVLNKSKGEYENALNQNGYNNINLKYQPLVTSYFKQNLNHWNLVCINIQLLCFH